MSDSEGSDWDDFDEDEVKPTLLVAACESGRLDVVQLLLTRLLVTDANIINKFGRDSTGDKLTPLMAAVYYEHLEVVQYLIDQGADPNIVDWTGANALHLAAYNNKKDIKIVKLLLENMTKDSLYKESWGSTPLDQAEGNEGPFRKDIITLIREYMQKPVEPATLGTYYTLIQFRRMGFPIEANRLTFTVPGKELDCDFIDREVTRFMPVKVKTGSNWDVDGTGKLFVFCEDELRQWVTTKVQNDDVQN